MFSRINSKINNNEHIEKEVEDSKTIIKSFESYILNS